MQINPKKFLFTYSGPGLFTLPSYILCPLYATHCVCLTHWAPSHLGGLPTVVAWAFLLNLNRIKNPFTYLQYTYTMWKLKSSSFIWYRSNEMLNVIHSMHRKFWILSFTSHLWTLLFSSFSFSLFLTSDSEPDTVT